MGTLTSSDTAKVERIYEAFEGKPGLFFEFLAYVKERMGGKLLSPWTEPTRAHEFYNFVRHDHEGRAIAYVVWTDGEYRWGLDGRTHDPNIPGPSGGTYYSDPDDPVGIRGLRQGRRLLQTLDWSNWAGYWPELPSRGL